MNAQQLLLPDVWADDAAVLDAEYTALRDQSPAVQRLDAARLRFAVVWVLTRPGDRTMAEIATRAGVSVRQAYRFLDEPGVRAAMVEVARGACDAGFARLVAQLSVLASRLAADVGSGQRRELSESDRWLAGVALRRAALDGVQGRASLRVTAGAGGVEIALGEDGGELESALGELVRRTSGTIAAGVEAEARQAVPGTDPGGVAAGERGDQAGERGDQAGERGDQAGEAKNVGKDSRDSKDRPEAGRERAAVVSGTGAKHEAAAVGHGWAAEKTMAAPMTAEAEPIREADAATRQALGEIDWGGPEKDARGSKDGPEAGRVGDPATEAAAG